MKDLDEPTFFPFLLFFPLEAIIDMFCDLTLSFSGLSVYCKACHKLRGSLLAVHAQAAGLNASSVSYLVAREQ